MSEKPHSSKTIMLITCAVAALLTVVIWPLSMLGKGGTTGDDDSAELRIQPVARVEMQKVVAKSDGKPRSGEMIYSTICKACHEAGLVGAPKTGDKAAWAPRLAAGMAAVLKIATDGKGSMPPRGGAADLTDEELKAAVDYLVSKAK